jgi:TPR repeat protein
MRFTIGFMVLIAFNLFIVPVFAENDSLENIRISAEKGKASAQFKLGVMYYKGEEVSQDYAESFRWFRKAGDQGLAEAQFNLGLLCSKGQGVDKNPQEAFKWFRKAAGQGYAPAQFNLGVMYAEGEGVAQNNIRAYAWLAVAAENDYEPAKQNLLYLNKTITADEIQKAVAEAESIREVVKAKKSQGITK